MGELFSKSSPINNLLLFHLSQKQKHSGGEDDDSIAENPPQVWENIGVVAGDGGALHFDGMNEREGVGDFFESAAHKVEVKPNAREPSREVGQERATNAAYLLVVEHTATEESEPNKEECDGNEQNEGEQNIDGDVKF